MNKQEFLNKWLGPAARGLKVLPEKLTMEADLDSLVKELSEAGIYEPKGGIANGGKNPLAPLFRDEDAITLGEMYDLKFRKERPEDFKEIGPDNWKFFGDHYTPPSA